LIGNGIARDAATNSPSSLAMLQSYFGVTYRGNYTAQALNYADCSNLSPAAPLPSLDLFGLTTQFCTSGNSVLLNGTDPSLGASPYLYYDPVGAGAPYVAGVRTDLVGTKHYRTAFDGFDVRDVADAACSGSYGRLTYVCRVLSNVIGSGCLLAGSCPTTGVGDDPQSRNTRNFLQLASANPVVNGRA